MREAFSSLDEHFIRREVKFSMKPSMNREKSKENLCRNRRLSIEQQNDDHFREQIVRSTLNFHRHREETFQRRNELWKKTQPSLSVERRVEEDFSENDDEISMRPNGLKRIENQLRLLNFSEETEKRLASKKTPKNSFDDDRSSSAKTNSKQNEPTAYLDERKSFLLKEFDELKHKIEDPYATISVLTALSRALIFLENQEQPDEQNLR